MSHPLELPEEPQFKAARTGFGFKTFISDSGQFPNKEEHFHNLRESYFKIRHGGHQSSVENDINNNSNLDNRDNNLLPLPDWSVALSTWGPAWELHIYGFSVLYLVLTVLCAAIFVRFRLRVKRFKIVYNTLVLLATAGTFRAVFMMVDPYGYKGRMAGLMVGIMTQAVYPLFCACYGLTQVMLLRITNVNVGRSRLRTLSCLMGCTLTYLFVVVIIETVVFYQRSAKLLLLVDSGCFIVWSLSLGITFICSGFRLTQYATETKRAHKELNAFCNHRRSASNTTWASAISNDTSPSTLDTQTLSRTVSPTASYSVHGDTSMFCSSPTFITPTPQFPTPSHRGQTQPRLSRPRLKISNHNHMTITIVTDDDDESTSSTDIDGPHCESAPKRVRRVRKSAKQKYSHCRSRSRSKTPTSSTIYHEVSVTDESCHPVTLPPRLHSKSSGSEDELARTMLVGSPSLSTTRNPDSNSEYPARSDDSPTKPDDSLTKTDYSQPKTDDSLLKTDDSIEKTEDSLTKADDLVPKMDDSPTKTDDSPAKIDKYMTKTGDSLIPHLGESQQSQPSTIFAASSVQSKLSAFQHPPKTEHVSRIGKHENVDNVEDENCEHVNKDISCLPLSATFHPDQCQSSPLPSNPEVSPAQCSFPQDRIGQGSFPINEQTVENSLEPDLFSPSAEVCSSLKENGYLADTENIFMSSAFSRLSTSLRRKLNPLSDVSSLRSSSGDSNVSPTSPVQPDKIPTNMSASLGLFRIRQSGMVQRAVHLTYLLTFLFMFACLLQLYTVFGVYGVLGSIRKPDPWPWLIFHTIFRATEVSIGLTIAAIAFITLNYRHQRARRRYQQQQHHLLAATRDCIV